jgi:hypothetical protein
MEECLTYFRQTIEQPESVRPWSEWWAEHDDLVRQSFDYNDYIRLKFRRLDAAWALLERLGRPAIESPQGNWLDRTFCPHCGERLMKFVPGSQLTKEEVVAFGHRAGIEQCQQGYWLHPGVYCPLRCVWIMMEFRRPSEA